MQWLSIEGQLQTNTFAHISRRVGVASVTLAAEGAVCVLAEAVVPTDGFIDALINICEARAHREVSTTLIFTASLCIIDFQTASVNMVPLSQNKHALPFRPYNNNRNHRQHNMSGTVYGLNNLFKGFSNSGGRTVIQGDFLSASTQRCWAERGSGKLQMNVLWLCQWSEKWHLGHWDVGKT